MTNFITREYISAVPPTVGEPLFVERWNGFVNIRNWSGLNRVNLISKVSTIYGQENVDKVKEEGVAGLEKITLNTKDYPAMYSLMAEVIAMSLCDEKGKYMYDIDNEKDLSEILEFDDDLLQFLFEASAHRNGLLETSLKEQIKN